MKKSIFLTVLAITFFLLFGCSDSSSDSKSVSFYAEIGRISKTDFFAVMDKIPDKDFYTFKEISDYRKMFREKYQYVFESSPGGTRDELYDILTSTGFTPKEANAQIDNIINGGNGLLYFTYKYSEDYMIWMYIELE